MPKIYYYDDIKIIKKPLKQRIKSLLKFFLILVVIALCFLSSTLLSKALTVGNVANFFVYGDTKVKLKSTTLYAVTLGEYDTINEAEKVALGSTIQGAGGYVWQDEKYYVIGNVYASLDEAEIVINNLKDTSYNVSMFEINYPSINLSFDMYENEDMVTINKSFEIFDTCISKLYEYGIKFDKKELTNLAIATNVSELRGEVKGLIVGIQNLLGKESSSLKIVQTYLLKLDEVLDQTILRTIDNSSTSYSLKYSTTSIARIKLDMFNSLN